MFGYGELQKYIDEKALPILTEQGYNVFVVKKGVVGKRLGSASE